ncbi:PqqA binding protein [Alphaproteobacteria bacterium SO-S41]|nr:PqqA binding protein [Alphaproteobacteria bacterium SO-S41]
MTIPRFKPGVRLHRDRVRDRWVLLAPERVVGLDDIAYAILEKVDGSASLDEIATSLAAEYDADAGEIATDASVLLADLAARGYVAA